MLGNHSKQSLSKTQLSRYYRQANEEVFGVSPFIRPEYESKFSVLEDDLREMGVSPKTYAFTVVRVLQPWARNKGMKTIPINVFCGKFAFDKFLKVHKTETVEIVEEDDFDKMLYSELLVVRAYIHANTKNGNVVRLRKVVEELQPMLPAGWLEAYECRKGRPIREALAILAKEFDLPNARSYTDIVDTLNHG